MTQTEAMKTRPWHRAEKQVSAGLPEGKKLGGSKKHGRGEGVPGKERVHPSFLGGFWKKRSYKSPQKKRVEGREGVLDERLGGTNQKNIGKRFDGKGDAMSEKERLQKASGKRSRAMKNA